MANGLALGIDKGYKTEKIDRKPKPSNRKGVSLFLMLSHYRDIASVCYAISTT